jgi:hypothetical protein
VTNFEDINTTNTQLLDLNPELREMVGKVPKRSKFGNRRQIIDGEVYDSGKESSDAGKFKLGVRNGDYILYIHHFVVPLPGGYDIEIDHYLVNSKLQQEFYDSKSEDGKATVTRLWINKKKAFKAAYGFDIKIL